MIEKLKNIYFFDILILALWGAGFVWLSLEAYGYYIREIKADSVDIAYVDCLEERTELYKKTCDHLFESKNYDQYDSCVKEIYPNGYCKKKTGYKEPDGLSDSFKKRLQRLRDQKLRRQEDQIQAINKYRKNYLSHKATFFYKDTGEKYMDISLHLKSEQEIEDAHKATYFELENCYKKDGFSEGCKSKIVTAHNNCTERLDELHEIALLDLTYRPEEAELAESLRKAINNIMVLQKNIEAKNWPKQDVWEVFEYSCYLSYHLDKGMLQGLIFKL